MTIIIYYHASGFKNFKTFYLYRPYDKMMLRKRFIIETINDQLKNISDIEHTRHCSPTNFMVNIISGLIAYTWQARRPSIRNDHPMRLDRIGGSLEWV